MLVPVPATEPGLIVHTPVAGRPLNITVPVGTAHEAGWVIGPTVGAGGAAGAGFIMTSAVAEEIHPASLVTMKLYVPGIRLETVVLVPVPAIEPGVIVQVPVAGRPLRATLPLGDAHDEGWVIVPTIGVSAVPEGDVMTTSADGRDAQPGVTETVKLYVPGLRFGMVILVPVPVTAPGLIVQVPVAGSPVNSTLPVGVVHDTG